MAALENSATSVSTLVGMSVVDASGKSYGRVHEFAVDVARDAAHVGALILRRREGGKLQEFSLPVESLEQPAPGATKLQAKAAPTPAGEIGDFLLLGEARLRLEIAQDRTTRAQDIHGMSRRRNLLEDRAQGCRHSAQ